MASVQRKQYEVGDDRLSAVRRDVATVDSKRAEQRGTRGVLFNFPGANKCIWKEMTDTQLEKAVWQQ